MAWCGNRHCANAVGSGHFGSLSQDALQSSGKWHSMRSQILFKIATLICDLIQTYSKSYQFQICPPSRILEQYEWTSEKTNNLNSLLFRENTCQSYLRQYRGLGDETAEQALAPFNPPLLFRSLEGRPAGPSGSLCGSRMDVFISNQPQQTAVKFSLINLLLRCCLHRLPQQFLSVPRILMFIT